MRMRISVVIGDRNAAGVKLGRMSETCQRLLKETRIANLRSQLFEFGHCLFFLLSCPADDHCESCSPDASLLAASLDSRSTGPLQCRERANASRFAKVHHLSRVSFPSGSHPRRIVS